jgi:hypothetical protein
VEDTALITDLGAEGLGFIPVYSAVLKEIARLSRFQTLGITKGLRWKYSRLPPNVDFNTPTS